MSSDSESYSQPSTKHTTPLKISEGVFESSGEEGLEKIDKRRKINDGNSQIVMREEQTDIKTSFHESSSPNSYLQSNPAELISFSRLSSSMLIEEVTRPEILPLQSEELIEPSPPSIMVQNECQSNLLPIKYDLDPELMKEYSKAISFFDAHINSKAAANAFRALILPELELVTPGIRITLYQWITLFYPMITLQKYLMKYLSMQIFADVSNFSELWSIRMTGENITGKIDQDFFKKFFESFQNFQINSLDLEEVQNITLDGFINTKFFQPEIKRFVTAFKNGEIKFSPGYFAISCFKSEGSSLEFFFARNTLEPVVHKLAHNLSKTEYIKVCRDVKFSYNVDDASKLVKFPHHEHDEFVFNKILFFLCFTKNLKKYLLAKDLFDEQEIYCCSYTFDYRSSSNPLFWVSELLLNRFDCPLTNFHHDVSDKTTPFFLIKERNDSHPQTTAAFLSDLSNKILAYSPTFNHNSTPAKNLYKNDHYRDHKKFDKLRKKLSIFPESFLIEVNDIENWKVSPERRIELEVEAEKKKPDVNRLLIQPLIQGIIRNRLPVDVCKDYIYELAQEENERGDVVCQNFTTIISRLDIVNEFKERIVKERQKMNQVWRNRRQTLAFFMANYEMKGETYKDKIEEILLHPQCESMCAALEIYFLYTLGRDFVTSFLDIIFIFDDDPENCDTKQKGIFLRGPSNIGKSFCFTILFLIFAVFQIQNSNQNSVGPDMINDPVAQKTRTYEVRAHFLFFDEFTPKKFNQNNTMPLSEFNELFNMQKPHRKLNIKNGNILLIGNAAVCLVSHHPIKFFEEHFDESFCSRWGAIIDLSYPIIYDQEEGFPERLENESEESFIIRLREMDKIRELDKKFIAEKPVFPLEVKSSTTVQIEAKRVEKALYPNKGRRPKEESLKMSMSQKVADRDELLKKNPISKPWTKFEKIDMVQAAYLSYKVLLLLADRLWSEATLANREERFPLRTRRSLKEENVKKYGMLFEHKDFKPDTLKPSHVMNYPELIESPQAICLLIVSENPNVLLVPIPKSFDLYIKNLVE